MAKDDNTIEGEYTVEYPENNSKPIDIVERPTEYTAEPIDADTEQTFKLLQSFKRIEKFETRERVLEWIDAVANGDTIIRPKGE